jgi:hypothetical protein
MGILIETLVVLNSRKFVSGLIVSRGLNLVSEELWPTVGEACVRNDANR